MQVPWTLISKVMIVCSLLTSKMSFTIRTQGHKGKFCDKTTRTEILFYLCFEIASEIAFWETSVSRFSRYKISQAMMAPTDELLKGVRILSRTSWNWRVSKLKEKTLFNQNKDRIKDSLILRAENKSRRCQLKWIASSCSHQINNKKYK